MGRPRFLGGTALWTTLRDLAKKSKQRRYVVAPYVGVGAAKLLQLKRGDVLLCALSEANARAGVVVPAELKTLQKRGVNVYVRERLHAKVYLFGRAAVVCSVVAGAV